METKQGGAGNMGIGRHAPENWMRVTGWSLFAIGTLFIPYVPWYILGGIREEEIGWWGFFAVIGGLVVGVCTRMYRLGSLPVKRGLLLLGIVGMAFVVLGQVPALFSWLMYGGSFVRHWMPWERIGFGLGMLLHIWLAVTALMTAVVSGYALTGRMEPELRLRAREGAIYFALLAAVIGGWWGWDRYQSSHWIAQTVPADGSLEVPRDSEVRVVWKGRHDSMGMRVRYADSPDTPVPGETAGSGGGMSYRPEGGFAPGARVQITVEAGRRTHTFTFTTASE